MTHAIADHLHTAAQRHQIVISSDALLSSAAADAMQELVGELIASGTKALSTILKAGTISRERLQLHLAPTDLAKLLNLPTQDLDKSLCKIDVPFAIRRRGGEMKIAAGETIPAPDATLIRALRNAHDWVAQMKTGTSIKQIASTTTISESYITHIVPMAFLSPRIQQAILSGSQPAELTLETIARCKLPKDWQAQERLFGFIQTA